MFPEAFKQFLAKLCSDVNLTSDGTFVPSFENSEEPSYQRKGTSAIAVPFASITLELGMSLDRHVTINLVLILDCARRYIGILRHIIRVHIKRLALR
jgi:hypothetical protein